MTNKIIVSKYDNVNTSGELYKNVATCIVNEWKPPSESDCNERVVLQDEKDKWPGSMQR